MAADTPDRPHWLDDEFLKICIRNSQNVNSSTSIQIKDLVLSYVVGKGENYMSVMLRANVWYKSSETEQMSTESFIVKVSYENNKMAKMTSSMFAREKEIYAHLVPELTRTAKDNGSKARLFCRFIHSIEKPSVIVLEDLKPQGFAVGDRHNGLDMNYCEITYRMLAKLHALSMCYFHSQPEHAKSEYAKLSFGSEEEKEGKNEQKPDRQKLWLKFNIEALKKHGTKYTKAIAFLEKYDDLLNYNDFPVTPYMKGNKFNALNHTDFWVNNIMFNYKQDGSVSDVILVDFQESRYTSVAYDFFYFFFTSTTLDVRMNSYEKLKKIYFDALVGELVTLHYKGEIPTLQEFEEELRRNANIPIFALTRMLPVILQKKEDDAKSKAISFEELVHKLVLVQPDKNYVDKMISSYDILQNQGYMDTSPKLLC